MLAVVFSGLAAWCWLPARRIGRLADRRWSPPRRGVALGALVAVAVIGGLFAAAATAGASGLALGVSVVMLAATIVRLAVDHRRRRARHRQAESVSVSCRLLANELRLGQLPAQALRHAGRHVPALRDVAGLMDAGGDPVAALRRWGDVPGADGAKQLAQAWDVARRTGAPLGPAVQAVATRIAEAHATRRLVASELSAARATGRLLGLLPLAGLGLGFAFGGDPLSYLTSNLVGQVGLVAGVGLGCAGVQWSDTLANRAGD